MDVYDMLSSSFGFFIWFEMKNLFSTVDINLLLFA